ncbi:hypothetical protein WMY93_012826 [Mugilogobius chulae]|uniref:C-type lectin domain-containing protein n=1 Tax=Mugilogobius chulae TaxID=88201 RepID=A0AAW0P7E2_9GOBI
MFLSLCLNSLEADLVTLLTVKDLSATPMTQYLSWIGLHRPQPEYEAEVVFTSAAWLWADGGVSSVEPGGTADDYQNCVAAVLQGTQLLPLRCNGWHFSFCQDSSGSVTFINRTQNWWRARDHCVSLNQRLATTTDRHPTQATEEFNVWTGLRYDGERRREGEREEGGRERGGGREREEGEGRREERGREERERLATTTDRHPTQATEEFKVWTGLRYDGERGREERGRERGEKEGEITPSAK